MTAVAGRTTTGKVWHVPVADYEAGRAAVAERDALRVENARHESFMRAIKDCRDDPASAIARVDLMFGEWVVRAHAAEAERDAAVAAAARVTALRDVYRAIGNETYQLVADDLRRALAPATGTDVASGDGDG